MNIKVWLASVLVALMPMAAGAVVLTPGSVDNQSFTFTTTSVDPVVSYTVNSPLRVIFELSGTAATEAALTDMVYTVDGMNYTFSSVENGALFGGGGAFTVDVFSDFDVTWGNGNLPAQAGYTLSANVIPLPAAGWMLISAMGGMAVLARRKKVSA